jgi:hypothetical protein
MVAVMDAPWRFVLAIVFSGTFDPIEQIEQVFVRTTVRQ